MEVGVAVIVLLLPGRVVFDADEDGIRSDLLAAAPYEEEALACVVVVE